MVPTKCVICEHDVPQRGYAMEFVLVAKRLRVNI